MLNDDTLDIIFMVKLYNIALFHSDIFMQSKLKIAATFCNLDRTVSSIDTRFKYIKGLRTRMCCLRLTSE